MKKLASTALYLSCVYPECFYKQAEEEDSDDYISKWKDPPQRILDTSLRTLPADIFYPWSSNRAGRAWAVADLFGKNTSKRLRYPQSTSLAEALIGGAGGALLGAGLGASFGRLNGSSTDPKSMVLGVAGGTTAGILAGIINNALKRRRDMREIDDPATDNEENSTVSLPRYGPIRNLLLPYAGPHRLGYTEIIEDAQNKETKKRTLRNTANALTVLGSPLASTLLANPLAGAAVEAAHGISSNYVVDERMKKLVQNFVEAERARESQKTQDTDS